ncbi:MAG TPA: alpha/beta hydrolase [Gammaproteobacteria bacterium]|jgi:phosphinothricin tripeptide acetyl hydrolase|nr:alpha/beta hydrolase [Candidatus Hydrogenedentota bacterium]HJP35870.1 alpha/beta hydrolase [Gammaproteobacteria bacterium]
MGSKELDKVLGLLRNSASGPPATLEERRRFMDSKAFPRPGFASYEEVDAGGVPAHWVRAPESVEDRVVLYLHGGGYLLGSLTSHQDLVARIARAAKARVFNVDYRLAPEHPFPAAVDDATAAYRWLLDHGVDGARVVVGGDSAGGGLAVAAMVSLRDAGTPLPAAGVCISPWVDLEGIGDSMTSNANVDPMVRFEGLGEMAGAYLGGADPRSPLAAPIYADLAGLPPLLIQAGSIETLLDDSTRLHDRAEQAGVDSTIEVSEDMFHVWHAFAPMLPEGQQAIDRVGEYVLERVP